MVARSVSITGATATTVTSSWGSPGERQRRVDPHGLP